MAPPPIPCLMDLLALEQYGNHKGQGFLSVQDLLFREQYGPYKGVIGLQVRLALEQYGPLQGQPLYP